MLAQNDEIGLLPFASYGVDEQNGFSECYVFIVASLFRQEKAGELAIRLGDSRQLFYLGHVGYHIDEPYRGHGYAAQACELAVPLIRSLGLRSLVITTDIMNIPSIRTCEKLGCSYECTVEVPREERILLQLSAVKKRFIWELT